MLPIPAVNTTVLSETNSSSTTYSDINWDDVIKKEARGLGDANLGEVQEVGDDYILTQKGVVHKRYKFYLPKNLVERFDGHNLWFKITDDEADEYKGEQ